MIVMEIFIRMKAVIPTKAVAHSNVNYDYTIDNSFLTRFGRLKPHVGLRNRRVGNMAMPFPPILPTLIPKNPK